MCYLCDERREAEKAAEEAAKTEVKEVPTSRTLTREMVLRGGPCSHYRHQFIDRFPVSVEVTTELAVSQAKDWDWCWAAAHLLSRDAYMNYPAAERLLETEYNESMKPFWDAHSAGRMLFGHVFEETREKALKAGESRYRASDLAYEAQEKALKPFQDAADAAHKVLYQRMQESKARLWAELFLADGEAYNKQHADDEPFVEKDYSYEDEDY